MKETTFTFKGSNQQEIFVRKWEPEISEIKGVLQIAHGMAEHSGRYTEFGDFMTKNGFVVFVNDHIGHGQTAKTVQNLGFFGKKNGWHFLVNDVIKLNEIILQQFPDKPVFLMGHSMGSFAVRTAIAKYSPKIKGAIISGTNAQSGALIKFGIFMAWLQGILKNKAKPSKLLDKLSFGKYNTFFKPNKTPFDWLSRDNDRNKNYVDDPFCGTVFSNRFFFDMLSMILFVNKKSTFDKVPKNLPILMFSGTKDPVGNFSKDVQKVYNNYRNSGVNDIKLKLYEDGRHEMLNETNRQEVYNDILNWLAEHLA